MCSVVQTYLSIVFSQLILNVNVSQRVTVAQQYAKTNWLILHEQHCRLSLAVTPSNAKAGHKQTAHVFATDTWCRQKPDPQSWTHSPLSTTLRPGLHHRWDGPVCTLILYLLAQRHTCSRKVKLKRQILIKPICAEPKGQTVNWGQWQSRADVTRLSTLRFNTDANCHSKWNAFTQHSVTRVRRKAVRVHPQAVEKRNCGFMDINYTWQKLIVMSLLAHIG